MKEAILIKINSVNLIIEKIEENLRILRQKLSTWTWPANGNTYHIDMKIEYYEMNLKKHINTQKNLFEEICKLN